MNFLDESDDVKNQPINSGWYYTYFFLSLIYIIFFIVYFSYSRQDFCSTSSLKWGKIASGLFLFALFFKSVGYCVSGSLIIKENELITSYENCDKSFKNQNVDFATVFMFIFLKNENTNEKTKDPNKLFNTYSKVFMVFSSLPGYCMSAAYCMIFYNWCSICIEAMERNYSYVYVKSRCVFTSLLIGICVCFFFTTFLFCFLGDAQFHIAEAVLAIIRDISLAVAFIIYLTKMWQVFADPCGSVKSFFKNVCCCGCSNNSKNRREESLTSFINYEPTCDDDKNSDLSKSSIFSSKTANHDNSYETALVLMCLSIMLGLIVRSISIIVYTIMTNSNKHEGTICDAVGSPEYTTGYLTIFIFETIISELLPVFSIITYRISHPSRTQTREVDLGF